MGQWQWRAEYYVRSSSFHFGVPCCGSYKISTGNSWVLIWLMMMGKLTRASGCFPLQEGFFFFLSQTTSHATTSHATRYRSVVTTAYIASANSKLVGVYWSRLRHYLWLKPVIILLIQGEIFRVFSGQKRVHTIHAAAEVSIRNVPC